MADTSIEGSPNASLDLFWGNGIWGPYWTSESVGAIIFIDTNQNVAARKTTNGGTTWGAAVVSETSTDTVTLAAWFDRQTPGDTTGTKIHVAAQKNQITNALRYNAFDIAANTWGTPNDAVQTESISNIEFCDCFITKTRNGNLVVGVNIVFQFDNGCAKAAAPYTSWTPITNVYESQTTLYRAQGISANTGDGADAGVIYCDMDTDEISLWMYDDSGDTWTETAIAALGAQSVEWKHFSSTTRLSDGHVLLGAWNAFDAATADLLTWDINPTTISSVSVTAKTNVLTDTNNAAMISMFINQQNNDVYATYGIGTNPTSALNIRYKKSTDGMTTWGTATNYSEDTEDDYRVIGFGAMGATGRFQPAWFDDDDLEIYINLVNDIEFAANNAAIRDIIGVGVVPFLR